MIFHILEQALSPKQGLPTGQCCTNWRPTRKSKLFAADWVLSVLTSVGLFSWLADMAIRLGSWLESMNMSAMFGWPQEIHSFVRAEIFNLKPSDLLRRANVLSLHANVLWLYHEMAPFPITIMLLSKVQGFCLDRSKVLSWLLGVQLCGRQLRPWPAWSEGCQDCILEGSFEFWFAQESIGGIWKGRKTSRANGGGKLILRISEWPGRRCSQVG